MKYKFLSAETPNDHLIRDFKFTQEEIVSLRMIGQVVKKDTTFTLTGFECQAQFRPFDENTTQA